MSRPRALLKVVGGAVAALIVFEIVAVVAWAAGAPTDVLIPIWLAVMAAASTAVFFRRRRVTRGS